MRRIERARREDAFTLIELMVVVLIIGILIAIALPTFLGARQRGADKQAQAALRIAHAAARICYTQYQSFNALGTPCSGAQMTQEEPTLTYIAGNANSTGPKIISIDVVSDAVWVAAGTYSASSTCFAIRDNINLGVQYARVSGGCNGDNAQATGVFGPSW